ncbi:CHAT domain-containing protein [Agromyces ramosus]|uniref:CHAT domain-containing protein n=1 Tax=Agromyces ramosus TaxID=33879 RepID=A0A4Q7MPH4_9MICO|nr:CHAT domain-containing protein [Agromyces ramosus]RZS68702.1 CHAT domain-containing protein [Agromyces ramosus]
MAVREYDDLQLRIDRDADGSYRVLAMAPDGRTARGSFTPPVTEGELDEFVQRVGLARRRSGSPDARMLAIKDLGSTLYDALIKDDIGTVFYSARSAAAERDRGLRITLRLSGSPELMRLPWEFLYKRPRFIAQSTQTPVVRALDVDSAMRPQQLRLPLRILAMVSSPSGYPELDADAERRNLERALEGPRRAGLVELTWLERATLGELGRRISEPDEVHVLHYIGHGAYDEATESGVLVLETPQGRAHDVSGEDIGAMLQDETSLRLVVLNACEGARTSHVDPFSGVATSLVNFDIPAVIGMQFEITDDAAIAFSESLYTGLARGLAIDAALAPARRAIIGAMMANEFGTPVLFLRDGDARLFDIADAKATSLVDEVPTSADLPQASHSESEVLVDDVPTGIVDEVLTPADLTQVSDSESGVLVDDVPTGNASEAVLVEIDSGDDVAVEDAGAEVAIAPRHSASDNPQPAPDPDSRNPHGSERPPAGHPTRRPTGADAVPVPPSADTVSDDPPATSLGGGAWPPLRTRLVTARGSVVMFAIVVASAWIAVAMLALTASGVSVPGLGSLESDRVWLITQTVAVAVLAVHHLARLGRDAAIAASGYLLGVGINLYALVALTTSRYEDVKWALILFGLLLGAVGAWLLIAGRKRATPFASSSRLPGPFVIASGVTYVLFGVILVTDSYDWMSLAVWILSLATVGMGVGYAISAALIVREGRPRFSDDRPAQLIEPGEEVRGRPLVDPAEPLRPQIIRAPDGPTPHVTLPITTAWIAAGLLAVLAWFTLMWEPSSWNLGAGQLVQVLALAVLAIHHFTRPHRDSAVAASGYALAVGASLVSLANSLASRGGATSINGQPIPMAGATSTDGWGYFAFGLILIVVGGWLLVAGKKVGLPYDASLRVPGPFVIAAGAVFCFVSVVWLTETWELLELIGWLWPLAPLAMAGGYAWSAVLLARAAKSTKGNPAAGPANATPDLLSAASAPSAIAAGSVELRTETTGRPSEPSPAASSGSNEQPRSDGRAEPDSDE